jgi:hypothetical protein
MMKFLRSCLLLPCTLMLCLSALASPDGAPPRAAEPMPGGFESGVATPQVGAADVRMLDLGHAGRDPYKAMVDDIVTAPTAQVRLDTGEAHPEAQVKRSLIYSEAEINSRVDALKNALSGLLGDDEPEARSDEERELSLQRDIAMRGAYRGAGLGGSAQEGGGGASPQSQDGTARVRLLELAFLLWDILTHPVTITVLVLYGLARLTVAIIRVAKDPHGRKKRGASRRHAGTNPHSRPAPAQRSELPPEPARTEPARPERTHRRHGRRHSRGRRSLLDRFRSV